MRWRLTARLRNFDLYSDCLLVQSGFSAMELTGLKGYAQVGVGVIGVGVMLLTCGVGRSEKSVAEPLKLLTFDSNVE